jgi:hypothetical protein
MTPTQSLDHPGSGKGASETLDGLKASLDPVRSAVQYVIEEHTFKAAALSLAVGVLLGWLVKR